MVERCALSGSDLKIKFRTILLTSISHQTNYRLTSKDTVHSFVSDITILQ